LTFFLGQCNDISWHRYNLRLCLDNYTTAMQNSHYIFPPDGALG